MTRRLHAIVLVLALLGLTGWPGAMQASGTVTGISSWYCWPPRSACTVDRPWTGAYAAAGPRLRVGAWRNRVVTVTANGHRVRVRLVDACLCKSGRVIDLYGSAFARLAPLSRGVVKVAVSW